MEQKTSATIACGRQKKMFARRAEQSKTKKPGTMNMVPGPNAQKDFDLQRHVFTHKLMPHHNRTRFEHIDWEIPMWSAGWFLQSRE